ncbi:MAG: transcription termination/antitermination protein NusG, partial [Selenomonas sp.]|nr:transcription termination/antitermination protein NusG [Selenomonas sp.]
MESQNETGKAEKEAKRAWYVIHTYSGYENKVKTDLESKVHSAGMEKKIFNVVVPTEVVVEEKNGHRKVVKRKIFPGYV